MELIISEHAAQEMKRRAISAQAVEQIFKAPQQILSSRLGRQIYQSIVEMGGKPYLLRLVIEEGPPPTLVTAYRTSKIQKYWRQS